MRYGITLAALALLALAAWVSWEDSDAPYLVVDNTSRCGWRIDLPLLAGRPHYAYGATPDRALAGVQTIAAATAEGAVVVDAFPTPRVRDLALRPKGTFTGYLTIYCCKGDSTGDYCGATASGVQVAAGMAACSEHWAFGTVFVVAESKGVVCLDRGSAVVRPNHLDIFFYDCGNQADPAPGTGWAWLQEVGTRVMVEVLK